MAEIAEQLKSRYLVSATLLLLEDTIRLARGPE